MNIACGSTQNAESIKRFLVIKPLTINKKINIINSLSCWSVKSFKFLCKFKACQKLELAGRIGDFGNFLNGFASSPRVLRWSRILNECNLSWKTIVKCYILYEVCMTKTAPHSTLSPQTWCIKKYKRLVWTHPDLLARICEVNLSNAKNSTWFVFQEFVFQA